MRLATVMLGIWCGAQMGGSSLQLPEYVRRFFQYPQMDIDYTLWQMLYLCVSPSRVYRTTKYHKQTKNQWARDGAWKELRWRFCDFGLRAIHELQTNRLKF